MQHAPSCYPGAGARWSNILTKHVVTLQDRYEEQSGSVFISTMQALVRLPVDQARRDRIAGLATAG